METKEKKSKNRPGAQKESVKDRVNKWISQNPKIEKLVDNTGYFIKHPEKFTERANEIFNKATNRQENQTLGDFGNKVKSLFRMTKMALNGQYTAIPKGRVILGLAALAYIVSPVDLFPDFLPFVGFMDDAAMMLWLVKYASEELEKFEQWEKSQNITTATPTY